MSDDLNAKDYREYRGARDESDPYFPEGTVHEDEVQAYFEEKYGAQ